MQKRYRVILKEADSKRPPPKLSDFSKQCRLKRAKSRNLQERLRDDEVYF